MSKIISNITVYTGENKLKNAFLEYDEKIIEIGKMENLKPDSYDSEIIDGKNHTIIPGFIDVHSHGGYGIDNMDGDPKKINELTKKLLSEGITTYFPTTMTQAVENIDNSLQAIKEAAKTNEMIKGIHLEGPFIAKEYRGAQHEEHIIVPNKNQMEKWFNLSGGLIRLVTYAPEVSDVSEFENYCIQNNIILSAGHSGAVYDDLINSKATHITHLFNAQRGLHHREPGVTGYGLLNDEVYVELIADGLHISKEMIKLVYNAKGPEGILLITDSMRAKGLGDGVSELGGQKVIVKNKEARLENGALAGSVLTFIDAFKNIIAYTGCSIEEAVIMSSVNQAKEFQLKDKGKLLAGYDADFLVLNDNLSIAKTILEGKTYDTNDRNK